MVIVECGPVVVVVVGWSCSGRRLCEGGRMIGTVTGDIWNVAVLEWVTGVREEPGRRRRRITPWPHNVDSPKTGQFWMVHNSTCLLCSKLKIKLMECACLKLIGAIVIWCHIPLYEYITWSYIFTYIVQITGRSCSGFVYGFQKVSTKVLILNKSRNQTKHIVVNIARIYLVFKPQIRPGFSICGASCILPYTCSVLAY